MIARLNFSCFRETGFWGKSEKKLVNLAINGCFYDKFCRSRKIYKEKACVFNKFDNKDKASTPSWKWLKIGLRNAIVLERWSPSANGAMCTWRTCS